MNEILKALSNIAHKAGAHAFTAKAAASLCL